MPLLTIEQARAQCRVIGDADDVELLDFLASAEDAASAYLNRRVYADAAALTADREAYPEAIGTAIAARIVAELAAESLEGPERDAALRMADTIHAEAMANAGKCIDGIVANPSILGAVRLTLGHLYENREATVIGVSAAELPMGAQALLRPYRRVMMP